MGKVVVILQLEEFKELKVNGPLSNREDRQLVIDMLKKAIDVVKALGDEQGLLIANNALVTGMANDKINTQFKKHF